MCCTESEDALLPPRIAAMLDEYRALKARRPNDWGTEIEGLARGQEYIRWLGSDLFAVFAGQDETWPDAVRRCLVDPLPTGLIVATVDHDGIALRSGPRPYALPNGTVEIGILLDSRLATAAEIEVDGSAIPLPANGVELVTLAVPGTRAVSVGGSASSRACVRRQPGSGRALRAAGP